MALVNHLCFELMAFDQIGCIKIVNGSKGRVFPQINLINLCGLWIPPTLCISITELVITYKTTQNPKLPPFRLVKGS